jgi:photosystem II stability/assembly factor-like uncharacterized protein
MSCGFASVARRFLLLLFILALTASTHATAGRATREETNSPPSGIMPGVVVVKFKSGTAIPAGSLAKTAGKLSAALASQGVSSLDRMFERANSLTAKESAAGRTDLSRIFRCAIPGNRNPVEVARSLARLPEVEYAEPKYIRRISDVPNDQQLSHQTSMLTMMNAFQGWTIAKGKHSVIIATIDGGTYWQHEDLSPNIWVNSSEDLNHNGRFDAGPPPGGDEDGIDQDGSGKVDDLIGWNFTNNSNNPNGLQSQPGNFSHGTATASHFGAATNNQLGMAGTGWNCAIMPVCAASPIGDDGIGYGFEGIEYAFRNGANVINCSWGGAGGYSNFEQDVINAATEAGALVVAAAGNSQGNSDYTPFYPANYKNVLAVGATNTGDDGKAWFSNYGVTVPVYAPGVGIWSALTNGSYGDGGSGTSYSSPLTAGLAGLLKSAHPSWTPRQIATQIRVTADSIDGVSSNYSYAGKLGRGRVNFGRALTESHPGIEIVSSRLLTTTGKPLILTGDTVVLSLTVKNILFSSAKNLSFATASLDAAVETIQGTVSLPALNPGDETRLPDFTFRVGSLASSRAVVIRLDWVSNGNDRDAYAFRFFAFPQPPQWLLQDNPAFAELFSVRALDGNVVWASGGNGAGTSPVVIRTTDGGATWTDATGNLQSGDLYCVEAVGAASAWVGTGSGAIYATTDGGKSWAVQTYPGTQSPFIDGIRFFDGKNGFALGDPASGQSRYIVLKTTDGGTTWAHLPAEPAGVSGEAGWNNSFCWTDPLHGWFGTNQDKVWRTTDGGASWTSSPTGSPNAYGVAFRDASNGLAVHSNGSVARTVNGGATWSPATSPTNLGLVPVAFPRGTGSAWTSDGGGVYRTLDQGQSWSAQTLFPLTGAVNHLSFTDTTTGWAVTSNGEVLKYTPTLFTGAPETPGGGLPGSYALEQNYPNPFNPSTVIRFRLPATSRVTILLFDILGRQLETIASGTYPAGVHETRLDAGALASGVYFYRLEAEELRGGNPYSDVKKLILMK